MGLIGAIVVVLKKNSWETVGETLRVQRAKKSFELYLFVKYQRLHFLNRTLHKNLLKSFHLIKVFSLADGKS